MSFAAGLLCGLLFAMTLALAGMAAFIQSDMDRFKTWLEAL